MFVHKKLANMSKFSLIILMGMSERWEALVLSSSSMILFISSILTSEKRNVCFSQLPCSASMLGWSLYLKISLRIRSAMFSVIKSNSLHFKIFRFLNQGRRQRRGGGQGLGQTPLHFLEEIFFSRIIGKLKMFTCQ